MRNLLIRALRELTPTQEQVARDLKLSSSALRRYRDGSRGVPRELLGPLAKLMRRRARRLEELATKLEEASDKEAEP